MAYDAYMVTIFGQDFPVEFARAVAAMGGHTSRFKRISNILPGGEGGANEAVF